MFFCFFLIFIFIFIFSRSRSPAGDMSISCLILLAWLGGFAVLSLTMFVFGLQFKVFSIEAIKHQLVSCPL